MRRQRGNTALTLILVIGGICLLVGTLKDCSRERFARECATVKGVVAGDVCVKPESVLKKKYET